MSDLLKKSKESKETVKIIFSKGRKICRREN